MAAWHESNEEALDRTFEMMFDHLYRDLCAAFPHPLEWVGLMERPAWWRLRARAAHRKVVGIFATHGFFLCERALDDFRRAEPQMPWEDGGGAIVRQLRYAFQYQTGVSYPLGGAE